MSDRSSVVQKRRVKFTAEGKSPLFSALIDCCGKIKDGREKKVKI